MDFLEFHMVQLQNIARDIQKYIEKTWPDGGNVSVDYDMLQAICHRYGTSVEDLTQGDWETIKNLMES